MLWLVSFGVFLLLIGAFALGRAGGRVNISEAEKEKLAEQISNEVKNVVASRTRLELERRMRRSPNRSNSG
jgi:uncharacterized membrane protein